MTIPRLALLVLVTAACAEGQRLGPQLGDPDAAFLADAAGGTIDADLAAPDANPAAPDAGVPSAAVINEFVFNHTGSDTAEFIEIKAAPSTDLGALRLVVVDGDGLASGDVTKVIAPGVTDASGYWLSDEEVGPTFLPANSLQNGTQTLLLVAGFDASVTDVDVDNDGTAETPAWAQILDAVAVDDGTAGDHTYAGGVLLTAVYDGGSTTVGGASRIPDGHDSDATGDWVRNDFNGQGLPGFTATAAQGAAVNTPGAANTVAP